MFRFISRAAGSFRDWVMRIKSTKVRKQVFYFLVASAIGLITGTAAWLLKLAIGCVSRLLTRCFSPQSFNWWLLLLPVAGIVLCGIYQRYILRDDITHGVEKLVQRLNRRNYRMRPALTYASMIASTLTLGFGGSAGSEGPIACTGAAIGSNLARRLGMPPRLAMIMIGCGAGAGIAGIFKAPVGGVLFTLEVLKLEFTTLSVMALFLSCLISASTAYVLSGCTVDLSFIQIEHLGGNTVGAVILLGAACGIYSVYYLSVTDRMRRLYESVRNPWLRNIFSGTLLGIILLFLPAMYGEGYDMMGNLINSIPDRIELYSPVAGWLPAGTALLIVSGLVWLMKPFAVASSNSGGGVAGDFAPTLFAGCFVGFFFATGINAWLGLSLPVTSLAFIGMAGVMAGTIRAPFMALFLTAEMTNGFTLFLPLLAVTSISYGIVRLFRSADYYRNPYGAGLVNLFKQKDA